MKKYIVVSLLLFIAVSCTIQQRDDDGVWHSNFFVQDSIIIETDCPLLTDDQFNQTILDTAKMHKLDINAGIQIQQAINRLFYEFEIKTWGESDVVLFVDTNTLSSSYFCVGKLDLQSGVNSLIVLEYSGFTGPPVIIECSNLWLFNIKGNKLFSVVNLLFFPSINDSLYPNICVHNGIFTCNYKELGAPDLIDESIYGKFEDLKTKYIKRFSTFKIDENGFLEFTKGSRLPINSQQEHLAHSVHKKQ